MTQTIPRTARVLAPRPTLPPRVRKAVLSVHVMASVALLGIVAAQLTLAVLAAVGSTADTPTVYRLMLSIVHGVTIPAAAITLGTSLVLGLRTRWGLFRYWWVIVKTVLFAGAVATAITVLRPALEAGAAGGGVTPTPPAVLTAQLVAFGAATVLSVVKPWGKRRAT
jgi:hypothetical protein